MRVSNRAGVLAAGTGAALPSGASTRSSCSTRSISPERAGRLQTRASSMPAARLWWQIAERDETIKQRQGASARRPSPCATGPSCRSTIPPPPPTRSRRAGRSFYRQVVRATHALNRHDHRRLLHAGHADDGRPFPTATPLITSSGQPDAAATWRLPGGKSGAHARVDRRSMVPLEYFEARSGELRFLGLNQGFTGQPLQPMARGW